MAFTIKDLTVNFRRFSSQNLYKIKLLRLTVIRYLVCVYKLHEFFALSSVHSYCLIMEIIKTNIGGQKLCYQGHMYTKKKTLKDSVK